MLQRRSSIAVRVGQVQVGGAGPVIVQSMTNTDTADLEKTVAQVADLAKAGSEMVRMTVNNEAAAAQVATIRQRLEDQGVFVPLIGDFHYNGHRLLAEFPDCAKALHKYRINPGNVGFKEKKDRQFAEIIQQAIEHNKPVRIGANWGSLDQDMLAEMMDENARSPKPLTAEAVGQKALIQSALRSAEYAEKLGLARDHIIVSCKVSRVQDLVEVYRALGQQCDYALHLGLTEAGMGSKGIVASSAALAILLQEGIGDTIRVSLTPEPGQSRTNEVIVAQEILQTMGLRAFSPMVTACPGCGRTTSTYFQELADRIQNFIRQSMPVWRKKFSGVEDMNIAVMGCIVNGPGESKHANIGISLPGTGESPAAPVFIDGQKVATLRGDAIAEEFQQMVEKYIQENYQAKAV